MSEPVILTFNYTEREYVSAVRFFNSQRAQVKFILILSIIVILAGCLIVLALGEMVVGLLLCAAGTLVFAFYSYLHFLMPRRYFQSNKQMRSQYHLKFSEDEIFFRTDNAESRLDWKFYFDVWENADFYFLLYQNFFTLIPKRVLTTDKQELDFRDLLKRKIKSDFTVHKLIEGKKSKAKEEYVLPPNPPDWKQDV